MILCSFDNHPRVRFSLWCGHDDKPNKFNGMPACRACYDAFRKLWDDEDKRFRDEVANCPDCQAAGQRESDRIQNTCTIDPAQPYGQHISLTCRNHPNLHWHTKNIDYIGARSIFWAGPMTEAECSCPIRDLIPAPTI